jgi:diketogulonate reductase-like aldo/keto reductase
VRAIGVSNYTARHLQELLQVCAAENLPVPAVNQVEFHPFCQQPELRALCKEHGVVLTAYTSLGQNNPQLMHDERVVRIAEAHGKTPAQVLLRWAVQQQIPVIPRSSSPERIEQNADVLSFELSDEEMQALGEMHTDTHFCWNPATVA